ncbi:MAG TPA: hypothetical protein PLF40_29200 [Kofleriaceae bacterium]|nr:hypothetical protein [Kofleriaceae bacterium]
MTMNYFVLAPNANDTSAYVSGVPAAITKAYQLCQGISRRAGWPDNVEFQLSDGAELGLSKRAASRMSSMPDYVENSKTWHICSGALANVIADAAAVDVELLPATILDHKGRPAKRDYFIVNVLPLIEAVDRNASVFMPSSATPSAIFSFTRLVLDHRVLQHEPAIFRLKEEHQTTLVREDVVKTLASSGLTGFRFIEPANYNQ